MKNKKAFSFVELIIVISILGLLGIIGIGFYGDSNNDANNTKTIADIGTLDNSIQSYFEQEKILPNPKGNINYFGTGSEYVHINAGDEDNITKSFGKHGFVTQNLLPKKYLNYLPLDPRTNQFYAYGKTTDNHFYEIAGVVKIDGKYKSKVVGNYPGEDGPYSLIREYNGPDFIGNNSTYSFPYNPDERILVAKIDSFSGTVTIINDNYTISSNTTPEQILNHTLVEGDKITVSSGGQADIYYSDGSQSSLGQTDEESKLTIAKMVFDGEENLVTKIALALETGTLWTKATKLNNEGSDFEVYTSDTSASVRGTIFAVKINSSNKTIVTVEKGTVEVKKIPAGTNIIESIQNNTIKPKLESLPTPIINTGETQNTTDNSTSTPITSITLENFSSNLNFETEEIDINLSGTNTNSNFTIPIKQFSKKINFIAFLNDSDIYLSKIDTSLEILTLTGATEFHKIENGYSQTKNKKRSLFLKGVELESTNINLSEIIKDNNKIKIYLCKYSNKYLKCGGENEIRIKDNKLKYENKKKRYKENK